MIYSVAQDLFKGIVSLLSRDNVTSLLVGDTSGYLGPFR